jgi:hypothetical protein
MVILALCVCWLSLTQQVNSFSHLTSPQHLRTASLGYSSNHPLDWPQAEKNVELPLLEPLSMDPLLFKSQTPILTKDECDTLVTWVRSQPSLDLLALQNGLNRGDEGAKLLQRVQTILDAVLLNNNGDIVMPKYLSYTCRDPTHNVYENNAQVPRTLEEYEVDDLLPDGLHVDTNNGKYFRHWTVLLYLNSCQHMGATTFPLATNLHSQSSNSMDDSSSSSNYNDVHKAAKILIDENVHHTRSVSASQSQLMVGSILDKSALDLFIHDSCSDSLMPRTSGGVRVIPEHGHFSLFSGLQSNGAANPKSFHGGEAMFMGESKEVLTFFHEIPQNGISTKSDLGKKVEERESRFLELHGFCQPNEQQSNSITSPSSYH